MKYVKWGLLILIVGGFAAWLQYTLPKHKIVWISGTDTQRINVDAFNKYFYANRMRNSSGELIGTDVLLIRTLTDKDRTRVFRNEDTGIWPPYFKFDSADLQTQANALTSNAEAPKWVVVRYYGWRSRIFTIYPNAVKVWEVSGPDARVIPWFNLIFLSFLAIFFFWLWRKWVAFRERRIDPVIDRAEDRMDELEAHAGKARGRLSRWWAGLRGK